MFENTQILIWAAAGAGVAIGLLALRILLAKRSREPEPEELPSVDLDTLVFDPRCLGGRRLELYNVPVQLAAVVLAPAGRDAHLPFDEELPEYLDQLSPGFGEICQSHQPKLLHWPPQLSTEGFVRKFYRHARLPGDHGKGSPWASVAGRLEAADYSVLLGLVLRSADNNSLGQITVQRSTQWLDLFRVRND